MLDSMFSLKSAETPNHWDSFWYGPVGPKVAAGVTVTPDTALMYSVCWAATRVLCGSAGLPCKLIQLKGSKRNYITDHPSYQAIQNPNDETVGMLFRASMMNHQINRGNGYAEIERTFGGQIANLYPIHTTRMRVGRNSGGQLVYYVRNNDLTESPLEPNDVLHFRSVMSHDGITGLGVVTQARESIGLGIATERHGAAYFGNGAEPRVVLKHPKTLDKEARVHLRHEWNTVHQGPANSGNVGILWEGMEIEKLAFNPNDSQFIETRQHNVEEIARWYGVPPHLVGHLLRATFSNIEHQSIQYVVHSLMPWLQMQEAELNRKLLTKEERRDGFYFKIIVEGLLRGDTQARAAFYKVLFEMGVVSPNDICELEDRDGIGPDGDQRFRSTNLAPLDTLQFTLANPLDPTSLPEDEQTEPTSSNETVKAKVEAYGIGVRAGAITPQLADEEQLRKEAGLPPMSDAARVAWEEDEGFRRPITLRDPTEAVAPSPVPAEDDGDEGDTTDATASTPAITVAIVESNIVAQQWLADTMQRMMRKETNEAKRAAKNSGKFFAWLEEFYAAYPATLTEAVMAPLAVTSGDVVAFVAQHIQQSRQSLLKAAECQPSEFETSVAACVGAWPSRYSGETNNGS